MAVKRVLVIDDDENFRIIVIESLREFGYAFSEAASGREARERLEATRPHLIILDVMMPDIDGLSLCREIRLKKGLKDVPILIVSALADSRTSSEALMCGATDFLTKPADMKSIQTKVQKILRPGVSQKQKKSRI